MEVKSVRRALSELSGDEFVEWNCFALPIRKSNLLECELIICLEELLILFLFLKFASWMTLEPLGNTDCQLANC